MLFCCPAGPAARDAAQVQLGGRAAVMAWQIRAGHLDAAAGCGTRLTLLPSADTGAASRLGWRCIMRQETQDRVGDADRHLNKTGELYSLPTVVMLGQPRAWGCQYPSRLAEQRGNFGCG